MAVSMAPTRLPPAPWSSWCLLYQDPAVRSPVEGSLLPWMRQSAWRFREVGCCEAFTGGVPARNLMGWHLHRSVPGHLLMSQSLSPHHISPHRIGGRVGTGWVVAGGLTDTPCFQRTSSRGVSMKRASCPVSHFGLLTGFPKLFLFAWSFSCNLGKLTSGYVFMG